MGMFDYIELEEGVVLPDSFDHKGIEFQTKRLHSFMQKYRISADGYLQSWINDGYRGTGEFRESHFFGRREIEEPINPRWSNHGFHGDVYFYSYEPTGQIVDGRKEYEEHSYRARFTEGKLMAIITKDMIDERDWHGR